MQRLSIVLHGTLSSRDALQEGGAAIVAALLPPPWADAYLPPLYSPVFFVDSNAFFVINGCII
jgi:hypothetical protein